MKNNYINESEEADQKRKKVINILFWDKVGNYIEYAVWGGLAFGAYKLVLWII